jgi:hypothetical protein
MIRPRMIKLAATNGVGAMMSATSLWPVNKRLQTVHNARTLSCRACLRSDFGSTTTCRSNQSTRGTRRILRWVSATKIGNRGPVRYERLHNLHRQKSPVEQAKKPTRRNPEERNKRDANPFSGDVAERELVLVVVRGTLRTWAGLFRKFCKG